MKKIFSRKKIFRGLYKFRNRLIEKFPDAEKISFILLFFGSLCLVWLRQLKNEFSCLDKIEIAISSGILVLVLAIKITIWITVRSTPSFIDSFEDYFTFEKNILRFRNKAEKLLDIIRTNCKTTDGVCFTQVKPDTADISTIVNLYKKSYLNTSWQEETKSLIEIAQSRLKKNPQSLYFIKQEKKDNSGNLTTPKIGFTHIVAINLFNWQKYISGRFSDMELDGENILSEKTRYWDEIPYALLIISLTLPDDMVRRPFRNSKKKKYKANGEPVIQALVNHLNVYLTKQFKYHKTVPVIFQTLRPEVAKHFRKYRTGKISKDYASIFSYELENIFVTKSFVDDKNETITTSQHAKKKFLQFSVAFFISLKAAVIGTFQKSKETTKSDKLLFFSFGFIIRGTVILLSVLAICSR